MRQQFTRWPKNAESGLKQNLVLNIDEVKMWSNFVKWPKNAGGDPK